MIPEIDAALRQLLRSSPVTGQGCEIAFDAPTRDWAARRTVPTVDAYLYDLREDLGRRERGFTAVPDDTGVTRVWRQRPRYFRLSYLVTAWTNGVEDEHRLLAAALACLLRHETLPLSGSHGVLAAAGAVLPMTVAVPPDQSRSLADIWSALGGDLKPSLDVVVTAPMPVSVEIAAAPPVTERLTVDARLRDPSGGPAGR
ncbi:Pvc16 family protein [Frankia sp. AgKG'84/4]|uniref:DUF4255 domain-containing protein n=1 Tax=Frankia sp. AgKG'84/4 TaxID=573490 RepID=UPI00200F242E|nr:DUF4255 domain-containing protein [Frankia sp. AgKG'84/4]MCL9793971.1 DUF4255 domain-containing protein [Frankia sp. AgKG'84/4]